MRHMLTGSFKEAWTISDAELAKRKSMPCTHLPRHLQYIWDGTPLDGKRVLIRCYHGIGDTVQFIRYASLVREVASHVTVWAQPALLSLLANVNGIDRLLPLHDGTPEVSYDVDIESMELPYCFRTTLDTIPVDVPYICMRSPERTQRRDRPAVGIAWRSGDWDPQRSIPFSLLKPIVQVPVEWHVLQGPPGLEERPRSFGRVAGRNTLDDVAAVMGSLDLVITVDTFAAHLAGALAVPVWTLLSARADWRWMLDREDSPWYPTMRLFRQERFGEWEPVIERVADELRTLVGSHLESEGFSHSGPSGVPGSE